MSFPLNELRRRNSSFRYPGYVTQKKTSFYYHHKHSVPLYEDAFFALFLLSGLNDWCLERRKTFNSEGGYPGYLFKARLS